MKRRHIIIRIHVHMVRVAFISVKAQLASCTFHLSPHWKYLKCYEIKMNKAAWILYGEEWGNIFISKLFPTKSTELFKKEEVIQFVCFLFLALNLKWVFICLFINSGLRFRFDADMLYLFCCQLNVSVFSDILQIVLTVLETFRLDFVSWLAVIIFYKEIISFAFIKQSAGFSPVTLMQRVFGASCL